MSATIPADATCLRCGYSLFNLQTFRCPECGQLFNPADEGTMWLGRPIGRVAKFLASPVGPRVRWLVLWETVAAVWGLAFLPGSYFVAALALNALVVTCGYAVLRGTVRLMLRIAYPRVQGRDHDDRKLRRFSRIVLVLCIASWFNVPRAINLFISRPFYMRMAMRVWSKEPMITARVPTGWYGLIFVTGGQVEPAGVRVNIAGGGQIYVTEEKGVVAVRVHAQSQFELLSDLWRELARSRR